MKPIIFEKKDLELIPRRIKTANKGTYKRVLVVGGSFGMAGAAFLSAYAALRTGAGLVYILSIEENREIYQTLLPEAIVYPFKRDEVSPSSSDWSAKLDKYMSGKDIIVLGPGLGTDAYAKLMVEQIVKRAALSRDEFQKLVIDADALNIIASSPELCEYLNSNMIVTPHPGEMSRLMHCDVAGIEKDRFEAARSFATKYNVTTVLKGHETVVVTSGKDCKEYLNKSGSPALAKAGSGDVLSGIIAGLMCLGLSPQLAAPLGVYVHGLAGEAAAEKIGEHSVLARDVADEIGSVINH